MRTVVCLVAVLLALTPVTQALAQAEQQDEQESGATETSKPSVIPFPTTLFPTTDGKAAILPIPAVEPDTVPLVRLEAASIFPITDSPAAYDSAAATPSTKSIAITIAVLVVVLIAIFLIWASEFDILGG